MLSYTKSRKAGKTFLQILFFVFLVTQICFAQWVQTNLPDSVTVRCFALNGTNIFAGTDGDGVFLSTDNGISWTHAGLKDTSIYCLIVSGSNLFAGAGVWRNTDSGLYATHSCFLSTNNGISWVEVNSGFPPNTELTSLAVSGNNLFAGTYGHGVYLSTNSGESWAEVNSGLTYSTVFSLAVSGTNLFAGTPGAGVFLSSNNGTNWTSVNTGLTNTHVRSLAVSGTNLFAGTQGSGVFLSTNNGTSWSAINNGLTDDLIAYWPFEGDAEDVSRNRRDGTVNDAQLTHNRFGSAESAYMFDGIDDYIRVNRGIGNPQSGTITVWAYAFSHEPIGYNQLNLIIGQWDNFQLALADTTIGGGIEGDGRWTFRLNDGLGANIGEGYNLKSTVGPKVILNEWIFVAATWNSQEMILYLNGTEVSRLDVGAPISAQGGLVIGAHPVIQNYWHGILDDIRIYSRDLSPEEIRGVMEVPWIQTIGPNGEDVLCFAVNPASDGSGSNLFVGTDGGVFQSNNDGASWTAVNEGLKYNTINSLVVLGANLYAGVQNGGIWRRPLLEMVPVELSSFTATADGKEVTLSWSTATELNNQGFEVQRKFNSSDFVTIGSVKGNGTTTSPNQYSYVDKLVDPGKYFYRLKQIDYGGTFEYTNEIEVDVRILDKFTLEQNYPNPFNPKTTIGYILQEKSNATLTLLNALGEEIAVLVNEEQNKGYHKIELNAENLSSGVYFYKLQAGNFIETRKMILLR